jgi:hypothetical protein
MGCFTTMSCNGSPDSTSPRFQPRDGRFEVIVAEFSHYILDESSRKVRS